LIPPKRRPFTADCLHLSRGHALPAEAGGTARGFDRRFAPLGDLARRCRWRAAGLVPAFAALLVLFQMAGCRPPEPEPVKREQILMGIPVSITIAGAEKERAHGAAELAFREIARIDQMMSTYLPESDISRLNGAAGTDWVPIDPELAYVIKESRRYSELSQGAFDITYKPLSKLWRFEPGSRPPASEAVQAILPLVDYRAVLLDDTGRGRLDKPGMAIGLGGIAKGYAVDRAVAVLQESGIAHAVINAGGDIRMLGRKSGERAWYVGIQDPRDPNTLMEELALTDSAVATSGDYERFFLYDGVRYHHILDPRTGFPARGCRSVTVISETAMAADALATTVFILGPKKGLSLIEALPDSDAMIVSDAGEIIRSTAFEARRSR